MTTDLHEAEVPPGNRPRDELGEPGPAVDSAVDGIALLSEAPTSRPLPPLPQEPLYFVYDTELYGNMSANNSNAFPALDTSFSNRTPSNAGPQTNGAGMNNNMPNYVANIPVGHQQDLNYLFQQFQELQAQLASNRDRVNDITRSAEEVARRANTNSNGNETEYDHEADKATIRDLQHNVAKLNRIIELYKHEQRENISLIAQYEDNLGTITEQIRNYCNDIDNRFLSQRRHYNDLLQAEKDEHLQSRLESEHWHSKTLELCGMINTAHRLRNDEWCDEYRVVVGLQTEVRCFRRILGLEPQKPEEETGWPYLEDAPFNDQA